MPYNYTLPTNVGLGASAGTATLGGVAHVNTTSAATTGTTEQILATYTLPANALSANGKGVRITAWFTSAANANSKTARVRFNGIAGMAVSAITSTTSAVLFTLEGTVIRTGASAQLAQGKWTVGTEGGVASVGQNFPAAYNATDTAAIDIVFTGTSPTAAGDVSFRGAVVEWFN